MSLDEGAVLLGGVEVADTADAGVRAGAGSGGGFPRAEISGWRRGEETGGVVVGLGFCGDGGATGPWRSDATGDFRVHPGGGRVVVCRPSGLLAGGARFHAAHAVRITGWGDAAALTDGDDARAEGLGALVWEIFISV